MADLDDFFAKKDRKKAKGKKFTTTDEIAKKLEETGKKLDKAKQKEKSQNSEGGDDNQQIEEEDEWKVFEEEKKDYTGLKIGNLTMNEVVDTDVEDDKVMGEKNSDGEYTEHFNKNSGGPWKKADAQVAEPEAPQPEVEQPQAVPEVAAAAPKKSYKPPALRNPQFNVERSMSSGRPRGKNIAPDINSEEYFPTLNSKQSVSNDTGGAWGRNIVCNKTR
ncbi:PREDICTED: protein CDV3 homolog isoform X2 [Ceratosolen solmsi marchali]|uniref:Protein CDV3 homolog isoform X2 n=1 Tax=Ceratosolen solmsi marchali TaxID=326594 RepID=A0AAJ7DTY0_9HYME|nr:PREDICTED: protein CDV3 homolog isoform X2 [Ceratosolen solmsi marchali]